MYLTRGRSQGRALEALDCRKEAWVWEGVAKERVAERAGLTVAYGGPSRRREERMILMSLGKGEA